MGACSFLAGSLHVQNHFTVSAALLRQGGASLRRSHFSPQRRRACLERLEPLELNCAVGTT